MHYVCLGITDYIWGINMHEIEKILDDRYKIIKHLGKGGMGSVYLAVSNDRLKQKRAIKVISYKATAGEDVLHEAFVLKDLEHDGIPRIVEIKECKDIEQIYIVQEYVEGVTLSEIITTEGVIKDKVVYDWLKQLSDILNYIHKRRVLHRDIKPDNIMLSNDGKIKLIDFGIALNREVSVKEAYTEAYASPEQLRGEVLDERSDIYSVGCVLYQALTGEFYSATGKSGVSKKLDPEKYLPGLTIIIHKCLQLNKNKRYRHTENLTKDVHHIRRMSSAYKRSVWLRDIAIGFSVLLILLGGISIYGSFEQKNIELSEEYNELCQQAYASSVSGEIPEVEFLVTQATEIIPERMEAYEIMAETLLWYDSPESVLGYIESIELAVDVSESHKMNYMIGSAFFEKGDYYKAVEYLEEAYMAAPYIEDYGRDYAVVCARVGDLDTCADVLDELEHNGYEEGITSYVDGEYYAFSGDFINAIKAFERAKVMTDDPALLMRITLSTSDLIKANMDAIDNAEDRLIEMLTRALEEPFGQGSSLLTEALAEAYYLKGEHVTDDVESAYCYESAIECFETVINSGYERAYLFNNIQIIYQKLGRNVEAFEVLKRMKDTYPDSVDVQIEWIWLMLKTETEKVKGDRDYHQIASEFRSITDDYVGYESLPAYQQLYSMMKDLVDNHWLEASDIEG